MLTKNKIEKIIIFHMVGDKKKIIYWSIDLLLSHYFLLSTFPPWHYSICHQLLSIFGHAESEREQKTINSTSWCIFSILLIFPGSVQSTAYKAILLAL